MPSLLLSSVLTSASYAQECANIFKSDFWDGATAEDVQRCVFDTGVEVTATDKFGYTQLHLAIYYGADASIIQSLVDAGANVNAVNKFNITPLGSSISTFRYYADLTTTQILLDAGADQNLKFEEGGTFLHEFFRRYYFDDALIAQVIIDSRADVNAKDDNGDTPLDIAVHRFHFIDALVTLKNAGAVSGH